MENIKGKFIQPNEEWVDKLVSFCDERNISRQEWSIRKDCNVKNCIEMNGKIYLVDVDYRWVNE